MQSKHATVEKHVIMLTQNTIIHGCISVGYPGLKCLCGAWANQCDVCGKGVCSLMRKGLDEKSSCRGRTTEDSQCLPGLGEHKCEGNAFITVV